MDRETWTDLGAAARAVVEGLAEKRRGKKTGAGDEARPELGARECAGRNEVAGLSSPEVTASRVAGLRGSSPATGSVRFRTNGPAEKEMRAALTCASPTAARSRA